MKLDKFFTIIEKTPEETKETVRLSMDILDRIHELLEEKFDGKQKLLALKLGKSEAEISKWLSGYQNFTIKTLAKLQIAFGEPIIAVCTNTDDATFEQVKIPSGRQRCTLCIDKEGELKDDDQSYAPINEISGADTLKSGLPA